MQTKPIRAERTVLRQETKAAAAAVAAAVAAAGGEDSVDGTDSVSDACAHGDVGYARTLTESGSILWHHRLV